MTTRRDFALGALGLAATCLPPDDAIAATPPVPEAPVGLSKERGYRLVKDWDFKSKIRDTAALRKEFHTRYVYGDGKLDHLNDEWQRYRDNGNHVFGDAGLSLVARPAGGLRPGAIESGMLRSRWTGQYGVYEIRMQAPKGRGLWPAFWLNPESKRWPPEIDVVEIVNNGRDTTKNSFHFVHGKGRGRNEEKPRRSSLNEHGSYVPGCDYADGFHVFSVEWSKDRVSHLVDGVVVVERQFEWCHEDGLDAGPAHVLANLAVGGKWPGPPSSENFPARLNIEYIRVWQR